MQNNHMSVSDTFGLGFMTFAFFLGAGNLIFPPFAGYLAGENTNWAMLGFLITAVGLPLSGLIAVAKTNGNVMSLLPPFAATALAVAIYIIIGPAFAAPRTGLVAYEIGVKPFIDNATAVIHIGSLELNQSQMLSTLTFFTIAMLLSLYPGKLLDNVGKVLTPVLLSLLLILGISILMFNGSEPGSAIGDYQANPLSKGIIEGYNTMDTLASLMFGMLIIDILKRKGITESKSQTRYLVRAAIIAACGLAFVYISLFILGSTAGELATNTENGGQILTNYVDSQFGSVGLLLLSTVVSLACLTTAVGLIVACSEFFEDLVPSFSYRPLVIVFSIICATVANVGLSQLISISIPVLVSIYPVAIALVAITYITPKLSRPAFSHRLVLSVALIFGVIDGLGAAGVNVDMFDFLPLFAQGMAWVIPTLIAMLVCLFLPKKVLTQPA
ncbi:branched-chain amino acid transport system II carrier protein [Parashewanella spongiae]|uniref:Branched-chain amino acid transport system carrier protein n=2 Tax=Parashewanella spongiae TaxID=342950 RepID=A0A3A6UMJ3_9GAMM|nr:branched-chain amino acid transport system II carrier protein [Parashewanella spongiae]MCL1076941.1 branched-chain amino acid transport system II carrier protein [Parashewanella spongiae]RJY18954.1 branched-chain amino acid transport system II carrier protein [Parashewanella spongiae]